MTIAVFNAKTPWIMALLVRDFGLDVESAAAVLGNLGHESGGLTAFQELAPTAKGSRGGFGWAQWTGPRRRQFEAYCARNKLDLKSDRANYGWLFVELKGGESGGITAVKRPGTLKQKVQAFELGFERSGVQNYASRNRWAVRALEAYEAAHKPVSLPSWANTTKHPETPTTPAPVGFWQALIAFILKLFGVSK